MDTNQIVNTAAKLKRKTYTRQLKANACPMSNSEQLLVSFVANNSGTVVSENDINGCPQ